MDFLSQRVQNTSARFVTGTSKYHHMTPILRDLHWLQVEGRVQFKIILVFWKSLHGCAPVCITSLVNVHCLARNLRSSSLSLLELPCRPKTVSLFFMVNAPLLTLCRNAGTLFLIIYKSVSRLDSFKRNVKTFVNICIS